jgi:hypothetical protein
MADAAQRLARIDKHEIADLPPHWTTGQRGEHLRRLLRRKGIDETRYYQLEYFPLRRCWLLIQEPARHGEGVAANRGYELFYLETVAEFRRAARAASAALAAHSPYRLHFGDPAELLSTPQELTPAELAELLGSPAARDDAIQFDGEGSWHAES